ncbi:hypothetical protein DICVIV_11973 [Dictyocaulus viviparus]|uniref:Uncharacterized protein n=1 Tax=Dictyocaulus viviparus TaxID=29172 RepID=A0A0D8XBQ8_DICVI|nr:hypothetical protein DICVIV_11973 [Dictyocaulus viviparus]
MPNDEIEKVESEVDRNYEDYLFLSELEDAVTKDAKETIKPKKIDKTALGTPQVEPPTLQPSLIQSQYISQPPPAVTLAPFSFPTYPTLPGNAMPSHFTIAPFILPMNFTVPPPPFLLPTHQTLAPIIFPSHPTLPPFQFPTHSTIAPFTITPPSQSPLTSSPQPTQYQMYGSNPQIIQTPQEPQKENALLATLSREPQQNNAVMINTHTQAELSPQQLSHRNGNAAYNQAPHEALNQPSSMQTQFTQLHQYNSYPQQQQQLQEQYKENFTNTLPILIKKTTIYILQQNTCCSKREDHNHSLKTKETNDREYRSCNINGILKQTAHQCKECPVQQQIGSLSGLKKSLTPKNARRIFPQWQRGFVRNSQLIYKKVNVILSGIVKQRLIECNRKLDTSHWDKVDELLGKISLSKSRLFNRYVVNSEIITHEVHVLVPF